MALEPPGTDTEPNMPRYFRIQPAGLDLDHRSEDGGGERSCLHVFCEVSELLINGVGDLETPDCVSARHYGDEIVVIEAPEHWDNGDVEGVGIDPTTAHIVERLTFDEYKARCEAQSDGWDTWPDWLHA